MISAPPTDIRQRRKPPRRSRGLHLLTACALALAALLTFVNSSVAADPAVVQAEASRIAAMESVAPTVVSIFAPGGQGGGSGVVISPDGFALSNYHVTSACGNFMKCGLADGKLYDAVIVGIDPTGDVALFKLFGRDRFSFAKMGDSDKVQVGDSVFAMGNPFLLASDFQPTVTFGIVSGTHRYQYPAGTILEYTDCLQVDASINPGNSGGPLFNATGQLVGINGRISIEKRGRVNSGVGYAISINQIKNFMEQLRSGRIVDHATLGATVTTRDDGVVVIGDILEESEAFRRGLRTDDELLSFSGRPIRSVNQFKNVLGIYPDGWRLPLSFRRDGKKQDTLVRLRRLHAKSEFLEKIKKPNPPPAERKKPDGQKSPDQPFPPERSRPGRRPAPAAPPAELAKYHVEKSGYANYYFNSIEQERLLKSVTAWGDFSALGGTWKFSGILGKDVPAEFTVADKGVGLELGAGRQAFFQATAPEARADDEPQNSGGLLAAIQHLRLLLTRGRQPFSEVYYQGSEPLDAGGDLVDVLVTELSGSEAHWYFSRTNGTCVGFDFFRKEDCDPCEIRFEEVRDFSGRRLPGRFSVKYGGQDFGTFTIRQYLLQPRAGGEKS